MPVGTYQYAMDQAKRSGRAGSIVPQYSGAGQIRYEFRPSGPARGGGGGGLQSLGGGYQALLDAANKAKEENIARYGEAKGKYEQVESFFAPGGTFGKGFEEQIERAKRKDVAGGMQSLVSAGLAPTTQAAGLGKKFEEEVGMPARLKLEDMRLGRYAESLRGTAGLVERREDVGPSLAQIMQLMMQAGRA
ncbi:MAG: hypothetical protein ACXABY_27315 [Candidatus Thorarchaeota archaeon]|jgi:hypothetical protein